MTKLINRITKKEHDKRNKEIRQMWTSRAYTKAEIGRKIGVTTERIRQILLQLDIDRSYITTDFDWKTLKKIRRLLNIKHKKSTHRLIENKIGIYKYPRVSIVTIEYFVYVLEEALDIMTELEILVKQLKMPKE